MQVTAGFQFWPGAPAFPEADVLVLKLSTSDQLKRWTIFATAVAAGACCIV